MNQLQILFHCHTLDLTEEEYLSKNKNLQKQELLNYRFMRRLSYNSWKSNYKGYIDNSSTFVFMKVIDKVSVNIPYEQNQVRLRYIQRLRKQTKILMKINSEHILKCYDLFQNQNFIIQVTQYCADQTLSHFLQNSNKLNENQAINIIKQVLEGLPELYKQNIFIKQLSLSYILIDSDSQIKIRNIGKNMVMDQKVNKKEIIQNHIVSMGKLFFTMIFGLQNTNDHFINDKLQNINNLSESKGIKLTRPAKQFLLNTLNNEQGNKISWNNFIRLKIFQDNKKLNPLNFYQKICKINPQSEYNQIEDQMQGDLNYKWDCEACTQFQKTQLIFHQIIQRIQKNKQFNLTQRNALEMMYLFTTRCMFNLNKIEEKRVIHPQSVTLKHLGDKFEELRTQVNKRFEYYNSKLQEKQNEKVQIMIDWLKKWKGKEIQIKDRFLMGFQSSQQIESTGNNSQYQFTKKQQIQFTCKYIKQILSQNDEYHFQNKYQTRYYLKNYYKICDLKFQDIKEKTFKTVIDQILEMQQ